MSDTPKPSDSEPRTAQPPEAAASGAASGAATHAPETASRAPSDATDPSGIAAQRPTTPSAPSDRAANVPLDPRLLEILVCPLTKGPLEYDRAANELICRKAGLAYPVRDGIPIMLVDEARKLDA